MNIELLVLELRCQAENEYQKKKIEIVQEITSEALKELLTMEKITITEYQSALKILQKYD